MKPEIRGLFKVLKSSENHPDLKMENWICGTSACMIGSFCTDKANKGDNLYFDGGIGIRSSDNRGSEAIAERFNISHSAAQWLFVCTPRSILKNQRFNKNIAPNPIVLSGEGGLNRLRKYLYFKMKQAEIHEAWNERVHTKHAQSENTGFLLNTEEEIGDLAYDV